MLQLKRKHSALIFLILISNFTYPSYSAVYRRPVTVERNPQNFRRPVPSPTPTPDFGKDINEINKTNGAIKQDVVLMQESINNLSKELNDEKTRNNENLNKQKELEENYKTMMIILLVGIAFLLIALYMLYSKIRKSNEKALKDNVDRFITETKTQMIKDFKINETDFHSYTESITGKKMEDFENALDTRFGDYNRKITAASEKEVSEFKKDIDNKIKKQIEEFSSTLENKFSESKKSFVQQIEERFPDSDIGNVIINLANEHGFLDEINNNLESNMAQIVGKEFEKIEKHLANKEKMIFADIQKVHLANNHFNIANIFLKNKSYNEAIDEFLEAIRIDAGFYGAYINLGIAYENNQQNEEALDIYKKAIEIKPNHYKAYFNLGNLYNKMGKYEGSLSNYKKGIEFNPKYPKLYNNIGIIYQLLNDKEKAKGNYKKAIETNKDYADAYVNLAKIESETGEDIYFIAEKYLKKYNADQETFYKVKSLAYTETNKEEEKTV